MTPVQQLLLDLLYGAERRSVPEKEVYEVAAQNGVSAEEVKAARLGLHYLTTINSRGLCALVEDTPCAACGKPTPFVEQDWRLGLCEGCTSPVTTWEWLRPNPPGRAGRRRVKVRAGYWPAGWPHSVGTGARQRSERQKTCSSVFDRVRDPRGFCDDPVVWRITEYRGRTSGTKWWCSAELPEEFRHLLEETSGQQM